MGEVAFVVMDLEDRKRPDLAFLFLNVYQERTGDYSGLAVLRFFMAYRAIVRAKVTWRRRFARALVSYLCLFSIQRLTAFSISRSHSTELATAVQRSQSTAVNGSVENARRRNGA
jgi:hypothetical protein